MSEEPTKDIPDGRSFEERVFARLDSIDSRLQSFDSRLEALETQAERRALETKPIWERALAEILELRRSVENVEHKIDVIGQDIDRMRGIRM
jgi:hypothetical protein